jgi:G3E family GTPase
MCLRSVSVAIDVIIVGGYLGSGKSSLVNHLLRSSNRKETGVIVNDLAPVNVDVEYVIQEAGLTLGIQDGCVCCSVTDRLGEAFDWMAAYRPPLKRILVEASGVGDPYRISYFSRGVRELNLCAMVTVVDASTIADRLYDKFVGNLVRQQIRAADRLIVNKVDLVPPAQLLEVEATLRELNGDAEVMHASYGEVDPAVIYARGTAPTLTQRARAMHFAASDAETADTTFMTMVLRTKEPVNRQQIYQSLHQFAESTERIKGVVVTTDDDSASYLVQVAGGRVTLTPTNPSAVYRESVLVFVFCGNDRDAQKQISIMAALSKLARWTRTVVS